MESRVPVPGGFARLDRTSACLITVGKPTRGCVFVRVGRKLEIWRRTIASERAEASVTPLKARSEAGSQRSSTGAKRLRLPPPVEQAAMKRRSARDQSHARRGTPSKSRPPATTPDHAEANDPDAGVASTDSQHAHFCIAHLLPFLPACALAGGDSSLRRWLRFQYCSDPHRP
jgi:hypothetical protein